MDTKASVYRYKVKKSIFCSSGTSTQYTVLIAIWTKCKKQFPPTFTALVVGKKHILNNRGQNIKTVCHVSVFYTLHRKAKMSRTNTKFVIDGGMERRDNKDCKLIWR